MPNTAHHCHRDTQPLRATGSTHTHRLVALTWVLFWVKEWWMDHGEHYLRSHSQGKKTMVHLQAQFSNWVSLHRILCYNCSPQKKAQKRIYI
nr:hypothetical protein CFP56_41936 [Quercus suber]